MKKFTLVKKNQTADDLEEHVIKTAKESTNEATKEIIKYVLDNPDEASSILQMLIDNQKIPNNVFKEASIEMSKMDEIPNSAIVEAVKNSEQDVPDSDVSSILKTGDFDVKEKAKLIQEIDNSKIQKEGIMNALIKMYNDCEEYKADEDITKLFKDLDVSGNFDNKEIKDLTKKIIAKRMASNLDKWHTAKIFPFSEYLTPEQMMEEGFYDKVIQEYENIVSKEKNSFFQTNRKDSNIKETDVKKLILEAISRNVAKGFQETGGFVIPQSKNMAEISPEEEKYFIGEIETKSKQELSDSQILSIKSQIRGKAKDKEKEAKVLREIMDSDLVDLLGRLPDEERNMAIGIMSSALRERIDRMQDDSKEKQTNFSKKTADLNTKSDSESQENSFNDVDDSTVKKSQSDDDDGYKFNDEEEI